MFDTEVDLPAPIHHPPEYSVAQHPPHVSRTHSAVCVVSAETKMGSNTSVVEVKQNKQGKFEVVSKDGKAVAGGRNKRGFKEVDIVHSDGSKVTSEFRWPEDLGDFLEA